MDPALAGLQLPGIGNFEGKIDAGFVFDRLGNYGLVLTARGPLLSAPPGFESSDLIGGDVQVEVSNAPNLEALNGIRLVEGVTMGSALQAGMAASNTQGGAVTLAASAGYGVGLEYGTGVAYTQVIPLGNVYALIPQAPRR